MILSFNDVPTINPMKEGRKQQAYTPL